MVCIFFGHRETYGLDTKRLQKEIEVLIESGVDTFYVGHQGGFDRLVLDCLQTIKRNGARIFYTVVLSYHPARMAEHDFDYDCSVYPAGQENGPPQLAIVRRNQWMIERGMGGLLSLLRQPPMGRSL